MTDVVHKVLICPWIRYRNTPNGIHIWIIFPGKTVDQTDLTTGI